MNIELFKNLMILYCMDLSNEYTHAAVDSDGELNAFKGKPHIPIAETNSVFRYDFWITETTIEKFVKEMDTKDINWEETLIELNYD